MHSREGGPGDCEKEYEVSQDAWPASYRGVLGHCFSKQVGPRPTPFALPGTR